MTDINLATKECLKSISSFGETVYQNICDGTTTTVPWGFMDYIGFGVGVLLVFIFTSFFSMLGIAMYRDVFPRKRY